MGAVMEADEVEERAIQVDGGLITEYSIQNVDRKIAMFLRPGGDRALGVEGNRVRMWYKSMIFLQGNLASRWHAHRMSIWVVYR